MKKYCKNCDTYNNKNSTKCYICGKELDDNSITTSNVKEKIKKIFTGKNLAITILSFILFCALISQPNTKGYQNTINDLNTKVSKYETTINSQKEQLTKLNTIDNDYQKLKNDYNKVKEENTNLTSRVQTLENENKELSTSITSLRSENEQLNNTIATTAATPTSAVVQTPSQNTAVPQQDNTSQTVWIGKTGTKYHRQTCATLKGKGQAITLQQALSQGRQACKVCKP